MTGGGLHAGQVQGTSSASDRPPPPPMDGSGLLPMDFDGTYTDLVLDAANAPTPVRSSQSKTQKRSSNYTENEDIQLCKSWENISSDPIISNEQPGKAYWARITEHFHAHKEFESDRSACSLDHRWGTIQKECMKFQGLYEDVERQNPSGVPHQELLLRAKLLYSDGKKKGFPFVHCWLQVRNCEKFKALNPRERKKAAKRQKASNATSSNPINIDDAEGTESPQNPESSQPSQRPMGRRRAKELKNGGEDGSYKNVVEELLVEKKEERKMKDLRWQEAKTMQERRISVDEKRLMWEQEQKIMFCDINTLDEDQKAYVKMKRAEITAMKMVEFSQSWAGSSGGSGTAGYDVLGGDASM